MNERPIDALDIAYSKLMLGSKVAKQIGEGQRRAMQRQRNERIAKQADMTPVVTRQQRRRELKLRERQAITVAKREIDARRLNISGGQSRIKSLDDIEKVLG